jgi:hypothetical protein
MAKNKKRYWAVCYSHVCRWAHAESMTGAALQAFGLADEKRMTVAEFPGNPRYIPQYVRKPLLEALFKRHKEKTGCDIT